MSLALQVSRAVGEKRQVLQPVPVFIMPWCPIPCTHAMMHGHQLPLPLSLPPLFFAAGISLRDTEFGLAAFILFLFVAAITPGSGKFVDDKQ